MARHHRIWRVMIARHHISSRKGLYGHCKKDFVSKQRVDLYLLSRPQQIRSSGARFTRPMLNSVCPIASDADRACNMSWPVFLSFCFLKRDY